MSQAAALIISLIILIAIIYCRHSLQMNVHWEEGSDQIHFSSPAQRVCVCLYVTPWKAI